MDDAIWKQLVEVHFRTKSVFLLAEELAVGEFKTFVQPVRELRDAHEHIMRAEASRLKSGKHPDDAKYQNDALRAALKHEVRAFYDCADWLAVLLRRTIRDTLEKYSPECIRTALPNYFSHQRSRIETICVEIAKRRDEKDASDASVTCEEVVLYDGLLSELKDVYQGVLQQTAALEDYHAHEKRTRVEDQKWSLATKVIAGLVLALVLSLSGLIWACFRPTPPQRSIPTEPASSATAAKEASR